MRRCTLSVEDARLEVRHCTVPLTLDPSPLRCRRSFHGRVRAGAREGTAAAFGSSHARLGGTASGGPAARRGAMGMAACSDLCAHEDWLAVLAATAARRWTLRPSPEKRVAPVVVSSPLRHPGMHMPQAPQGRGWVRGSPHLPMNLCALRVGRWKLSVERSTSNVQLAKTLHVCWFMVPKRVHKNVEASHEPLDPLLSESSESSEVQKTPGALRAAHLSTADHTALDCRTCAPQATGHVLDLRELRGLRETRRLDPRTTTLNTRATSQSVAPVSLCTTIHLHLQSRRSQPAHPLLSRPCRTRRLRIWTMPWSGVLIAGRLWLLS